MTARQPYPDKPVLIVDDEAPWLRSLSLLLERSLDVDHIRTCRDSREVLDLLGAERFSLVLLDVTMPYLSGDQLLPRIRERYPDLPVIIISGRNQVDIAVRCMKEGAFDYFVKSVDEDRLVTGIRHALELNALQDENASLKQSLLARSVQHPEAFAAIVTRSPAMEAIFRYLEAIAPSPEPVLVTGESGVGKEPIARAVHQLSTPAGPWVAVNVAGLDDLVFADTLFGHVRGAYTDARESRPGMLEQARNGTLFLDEIGDLSLPSQVKLLRLLQEREYAPLGSDKSRRTNARLVFATNQNLQERIEEGRFRQDLFYRLNTHRVHVPPLRARPEDIDLLAGHFLAEAAAALGKRRPTPPRELWPLLRSYAFPGNVRELRAMAYDAVSRHDRGVLSLHSFQTAIETSRVDTIPAGEESFAAAETGIRFPATLPTLKEAADQLVDEALRRTDYNQTRAARLLGVTRPALGKRLAKRRQQSDPDRS